MFADVRFYWLKTNWNNGPHCKSAGSLTMEVKEWRWTHLLTAAGRAGYQVHYTWIPTIYSLWSWIDAKKYIRDLVVIRGLTAYAWPLQSVITKNVSFRLLWPASYDLLHFCSLLFSVLPWRLINPHQDDPRMEDYKLDQHQPLWIWPLYLVNFHHLQRRRDQ